MGDPVKPQKKLFFIMVHHPVNGWIRATSAYASKAAANEWKPFVRYAWRFCPVKVSQFTARFVDGKLDPRSREVLGKKYNLETEGM